MKQLRGCQIAGTLALLSWAVIAATEATAEKKPDGDTRRVIEPGAMLAQAAPSIAALTKCQPRRGDLVVIQRITGAVGMPSGLAEVNVLTGPCRGESGWVGVHRLTESGAGR